MPGGARSLLLVVFASERHVLVATARERNNKKGFDAKDRFTRGAAPSQGVSYPENKSFPRA